MQRGRQIAVIAAIILFNCLPWGALRWEWIDPSPSLIQILFAVYAAQTQTFAAWLALSTRSFVWNAAILVALVALIPRSLIATQPTVTAWTVVGDIWHLKGQLAAGLITLGLVTLLRYTSGHSIGSSRQGEHPRFTLGSIAWWMIGAGCLTVVCTKVFPSGFTEYGLPFQWAHEIPYYLAVASLTATSLWVASGRNQILLRLGSFAAAISVASCWSITWDLYRLEMRFLAGGVDTWWHHGLMAAWIIATFALFRWAGVGTEDKVIGGRPLDTSNVFAAES